MKHALTLVTTALAMIATPALADTVQTELTVGNVTNDRADNKAFRIEYNGSKDIFIYSIELEAQETKIDSPVQRAALSRLLGTNVDSMSTVYTTASGGIRIPTKIATISTSGQLGRSSNKGIKYEFWGVEVDANRKIYGPVNGLLSYRHRQSFGTDRLNVEQISAGLVFELSKKMNLDVTYYHDRGTFDNDSIGIGITRKF